MKRQRDEIKNRGDRNRKILEDKVNIKREEDIYRRRDRQGDEIKKKGR